MAQSIPRMSGCFWRPNGATDSHSLTVGATGVVQANVGVGASINGADASITNFGQISSVANHAVNMSGASTQITNYGSIYSDGNTGVYQTGSSTVLANFGSITSNTATGYSLELSSGNNRVENHGTISGFVLSIKGSVGVDTVVNSGTLVGFVDLADGADAFYGSRGGEAIVVGAAGNDTIRGSAFDDDLNGNGDNDLIFGRDGLDTLTGGTGFDTLRGGGGEDTFRFVTLAEMGNAIQSDRIGDFTTAEDVIDLSAIPGTFSFVGNAAFSLVIDQIRYAKAAGQLQIDHNGDGVGDFFLQLTPGKVLVADDLIL